METTRLDQLFSQTQAAIASRGMKAANAIGDVFSSLIRQRLHTDELEPPAMPAVRRAEPPKSTIPVGLRQDAAPAQRHEEQPPFAKPERAEMTFSGQPDIRAAEHAAPNARVHEMNAVCHGSSAGKCADEPSDPDAAQNSDDDTAPTDATASEPEANGTQETDTAESDAPDPNADTESGEPEDGSSSQASDASDTSVPLAAVIENIPQGQIPPTTEPSEESTENSAPVLAEESPLPGTNASADQAIATDDPAVAAPGEPRDEAQAQAEPDAIPVAALVEAIASTLTSEALLLQSSTPESSSDETANVGQPEQSAPQAVTLATPAAEDAPATNAIAPATALPPNEDAGLAVEESAEAFIFARAAEDAGKPRTQASGQAGKENTTQQSGEPKLASTQTQANVGSQTNTGFGQGQGQGKNPSPPVGQSQPSQLNPVGFDVGMPGQPGWSVHLAQGLVVNGPARRAEFVANLRQHLQNLPLHDQVALSIQRSIRDGTGRISLQLSPAELGRVHVKLDIDEDNRVQATVTVERPTTLDMLQRDIRALERALQEAGLKTDSESLSFNLRGGQADGFDREMGSAGNGRGGGSGSDNGAPERGDDKGSPLLKPALVATAEGLVDVEV